MFSDLTVRENLELGSYATKDYDWDRVTAYFPKSKQLMDRKAGYLSGGERQMLMIARACSAGRGCCWWTSRPKGWRRASSPI